MYIYISIHACCIPMTGQHLGMFFSNFPPLAGSQGLGLALKTSETGRRFRVSFNCPKENHRKMVVSWDLMGFTLWKLTIAIEHDHFFIQIFPLNIVIFHSYVTLPKVYLPVYRRYLRSDLQVFGSKVLGANRW